jgi:glycosyltransferase involved in cell wall biosynthesis
MVSTTIPAVVHFSSVHRPFDVRIFEKQCRSLAADGWDVTFVVPHTGDDQRAGVTIRAVPRVRSRALRMVLTTTRVALRVLRLRADIYHFHDPELLPLGILLKLLGRRVVYDSHEDLPRVIPNKPYLAPFLRRPIGRACELLENWCARRFDAVVAATDHIGVRFEGVGARTVVVANHPQLNDFPPPPERWDKENAVCYVGGISRIRGILEIIDAAELAGVRLILAGQFISEELRAEAMARPGWKWVEELGMISRDATVQVMRRSFAGLVVLHATPNHIVSEPNKMFEYMAAGLPVIASDFPLWRRFVENEGAGVVVDPMDRARVAEEIRKLRDNPEHARQLGIRGRHAVEEIYNWVPQYKKLRALYAEITGRTATEGNA